MISKSGQKKKRNLFLTANKYQDSIILLCFLPSALIFISFMLIVFIGNPILSKALLNSSSTSLVNMIYVYSGAIVACLCAIILFSVGVSFMISHRLVGAFGRIINELDAIIDGRSKKTITSRPGDKLAEDLLKRVNVLASFYVKHKDNNNK